MYPQLRYRNQSPTLVKHILTSSTARVIAYQISFVFLFIFLTLCLYLYGINLMPQFSYMHTNSIARSEWIEAALETEIDDPLNISALKEVCSKKSWRKGLVFECPRPAGGVGNVRNKVLTCVRYAIEAGADFVIPGIMARSKNDLSTLVTETIMDFEYMFSRTHFIDSLGEACPQMKIYNDLDHYSQHSWTKTYIRLDVGNLVSGSPRENWIANPEIWSLAFGQWLAKNKLRPSMDEPVVVNIGHPLFQWPMSYESPDLRKALGRTLRFNDEVRRLASSVLYTLGQVVLRTDLSASKEIKKIDPSVGIIPKAFFGAHLRTDKDAKEAGWPSYESQSRQYISQAISHSLSTIYVSCGSTSDITRFKKESWDKHRLHVYSKDMLLTGTELSALRNLTWDQQGLVDYEILLKSSAFGGMDGSTFALNIALRRHLLSSMTYERGPEFPSNEEGLTISDEYSQVFVGSGNGVIITQGMWP